MSNTFKELADKLISIKESNLKLETKFCLAHEKYLKLSKEKDDLLCQLLKSREKAEEIQKEKLKCIEQMISIYENVNLSLVQQYEWSPEETLSSLRSQISEVSKSIDLLDSVYVDLHKRRHNENCSNCARAIQENCNLCKFK